MTRALMEGYLSYGFQLSPLLIILVIFGSPYAALAQDVRWSSLEYRNISLNNINLGGAEAKLVSLFGKPDSVLYRNNEFEGSSYRVFRYGNSDFYLKNGKVTGFNINESRFLFDHGEIRVGQDGNKLKHLFPLSFRNRYQDNSKTIVKVRIAKSDSYILFACDADNRITRIQTWEDL